MPTHRRRRRSAGSFSDWSFNMVPASRRKFLERAIQAFWYLAYCSAALSQHGRFQAVAWR